jgi:ethanolamine ammonia-lyase small subunit
VGTSLPTEEVLNFGYAHAMARDAVHLPLDVDMLERECATAGWAAVHVQSRAADRTSYLLRPDLGRRVDAAGLEQLQAVKSQQQQPDLVFVIGDGLSALAIHKHAIPLMVEVRRNAPAAWQFGTVVMASQARVAIGDEIGAALGARVVAVLIGERPGLSSPDSLGIYLTYDPKVGRHDAERNCISNVRLEGLSYTVAAKKLVWLAQQAMRLQLSGVDLKDESDRVQIADTALISLPSSESASV